MLGGRIAPRPAVPTRRPAAQQTLAESKLDGTWSGQGVGPEGVTYPAQDQPSGGPHPIDTPEHNLSVLDKPTGTPRPQRGGATMGHSLEYFEYPTNDGGHTVLRRAARVVMGEMLPWRPQRPASWRERPRSGDAPPACPAGGTEQ